MSDLRDRTETTCAAGGLNTSNANSQSGEAAQVVPTRALTGAGSAGAPGALGTSGASRPAGATGAAGPGGMAPGSGRFVAVDLGASSGRVHVGEVNADALRIEEAARFPNVPVEVNGRWYWDILGIYQQVRSALERICRSGPVTSAGIDSWGVDYGLTGPHGRLVENPVHYRDTRTDGMPERVAAQLGAQWLYERNGVTPHPFNTIYQLLDPTQRLEKDQTLLLLPDLLGYWLTGAPGVEVTNASTTGLLGVGDHQWDTELMDRLGIPPAIFPPLRRPGDVVGQVRGESFPVVAVGSHDTASAVAGVPAATEHFAYISCGTWSLVGLELDRPLTSEASRLAGFTNETGVDDTVRYLHNVMGLWLLQECERHWRRAGLQATTGELCEQASSRPALVSVIDPDDPRLFAPEDMPASLAACCQEAGQPVPADPPAMVRCILDSLALAYRHKLHQAAELTGRRVEAIHLVGGGVRNRLLCQLTADACEHTVLAGPVEAAAAGNVLVQARAAGVVRGGLGELRSLLRAHCQLETYQPSSPCGTGGGAGSSSASAAGAAGSPGSWAAAERRVYGVG